MIPPEKVEKAERWSAHYGAMGIFISRLLPVVRQLIGIPAGIVRMDYLKFSLFTLLGSAIWCAVLCYVGVKAGQDEKVDERRIIASPSGSAGAMLVLGGLYYFFVHRHMTEKSRVQSPKSKVRINRGSFQFCDIRVSSVSICGWIKFPLRPGGFALKFHRACD